MQLLKKVINSYTGKILILGAGVYQIPLIKKAKEMGLKTIVVSCRGNYPGFNIADKNYYVDTTSSEEVLDIARKEHISGICTTGSDVPMVTLGKVADELKLVGITEKSGILSTNKVRMKERFKKYNVRAANFMKASSARNTKEAVNVFKLPVVFKVVDSSGSRGVFIVSKIKEIDNIIKAARSETKKNYFIVEEFLEGREFGAQALVYNNEVKFILPHGDFVFKANTNIPVGHFVPIKLKKNIVRDLYTQLKRSIRSLELNNCAINADFILKDNKVFVLEIGARAGATCLSELVSIYFGFNYYQLIINMALGKEPDFRFRRKLPNASMLLFSNKSGNIRKIIDKNIPDEDIVEIKFDYGVGDRVKKFRVGSDRIGHIIVKGNTLKDALNLLRKVRKNIFIQVE